MKFSKILLPVDGSKHSMKAAESAIELARISGGEIILLHCHRPVPVALGEPNFQHLLDDYNRDANEVLDPFRDLLAASGAAWSEKVIGGSTAATIVDVAELDECDLIVMGSKGKSDLEGLIVGSVTHKVLSLATCPVLVVR